MPHTEWEPLQERLADVARQASVFADAFGWEEVARVAGRRRDIGKCPAEFQAYIKQPIDEERRARGPDHSTAGAREAEAAYPGQLGRRPEGRARRRDSVRAGS